MHLIFLEPFLTPILFIGVTVVLAVGFFILWSIYSKEQTFEKKREEEFSDYEKVLTQAHTKAEHIIEEATTQASTLSHEGADFTKNLQTQTDASMRSLIEKNTQAVSESSQTFLNEYKQFLQELRTSSGQELQKTFQTMQEETIKEFTTLQETIRNQTAEAQGGLQKQLEDQFNKTQIEIHEYKKRKFQETTLQIDKLIMQVAEEVLGQAIPLSQQQQLITQALEKAQKEGLFDT